jgi:hypothetical protein
MATSSITSKDEFRNVTDGWLGVVTIDHTGKASGTSVEPGGSCFMTEEEQILTANAPRSDEDNPFTNGSLRLLRRGLEIKNRRPYGAGAFEAEPEADETETGASASPRGSRTTRSRTSSPTRSPT